MPFSRIKELPVEFQTGLAVSGMGGFRRVKGSEIVSLVPAPDRRSELLAAGKNAFVTRRVGRIGDPVVMIGGAIAQTQISDAVVIPHAVDMVDDIGRYFTMENSPSDVVYSPSSPLHRASQISIRARASYYISRLRRSYGDASGHNSGFGFILEKLTQILRCDLRFISHSAVLSHVGQGLALCHQRLRPAHNRVNMHEVQI